MARRRSSRGSTPIGELDHRSPSRWLREHSEHYLMIGAQEQLARRHPGTRPPRRPHGPVELFWLRGFAPLYRALPWPLRHRILRAMPGSHRQTWAPPPTARGPAV